MKRALSLLSASSHASFHVLGHAGGGATEGAQQALFKTKLTHNLSKAYRT